MFTTITQYIIGREAIAENDFQCYDKVSYVDSSENPEAAPDRFLATIIAEVIDKEADDS